MNDVQEHIKVLRDKGWTLAAIADEVGVSTRAAEYWQQGARYPENAKAVMIVLDALTKRKRVPKQRRYAGTHHLQRKADD